DYAPELRSNVCWNGVSVTLMGPNGCGSAGLAYYLEHGLVIDPLSNLVLAIQPVIDTCDAGFCVPNQINPGEELIDGVACCNPKSGECKAPDENGVCNFGDITWCKKLENNGDGTVTCHE